MRLEDLDWLRARAHRCRTLAEATPDPRTAETLRGMAGQYEARAAEIEQAGPPNLAG